MCPAREVTTPIHDYRGGGIRAGWSHCADLPGRYESQQLLKCWSSHGGVKTFTQPLMVRREVAMDIDVDEADLTDNTMRL